MNNSDLNFTIVFDLSQTDPVCTFQDTTNYAAPPSGTGAVNSNYITTYLEVIAPSGVVWNSLNATALLGDPDIYPFLNQSYKDIDLPVNSDGDVPSGTYSFRLQSRLWTGAQGVTIVSASSTGDSFVLTGNVATQITALIGGYFIIDAGVNEGVFTVVSATYDAGTGTTTVVVDEDVVDDAVGGDVFLYFTGYTDYTSTVQTQYFDFTEPTISITKSFDCRTAKLTVVDTSGYLGVNASTSYSPVSTNRTLTLTAPVNPDGTGYSPTSNTTTATSLELTNIYTGMWTIGVYTELFYTLSSFFSVIAGVQRAETIDVQCDDCVCSYFTCIDNLWDKYYAALNRNITRANTIRAIMVELNHTWMLYQMASQCGYDTTDYCAKIVELAAADDCTCTSTDTGLSVAVVPWGSGATGTAITGAKWYNDSGAPSSLLGDTDDYYLDDDTGNYYKKVSGSWVLQGSLKGSASSWLNGTTTPAGALGSVGDYYLDTVTKEYFEKTGTTTWTSLGYLMTLFKIHGDMTQSALIATGVAQVLKTYTLPADTLLTVGDEIIIEAYLSMRAIAGASTLSAEIAIGAGTLFSASWVTPSNPEDIRVYLKFMVSATNVLSGNRSYTITGVYPSEVYENTLNNVGVTLSSAQDINLTCQSTNGAAGDITVNGWNIYILKQ